MSFVTVAASQKMSPFDKIKEAKAANLAQAGGDPNQAAADGEAEAATPQVVAADGSTPQGGGGGDLEARVTALEQGQGGGAARMAKAKKGRTSGIIKKLSLGLFGGKKRGGLFSDERLKENIVSLGVSPSGIPIYKFNYIGDRTMWSGTMAQDLLEMGIKEVVSKDKESGYYMVDYSCIDVEPKILN